MSDDEIYEILDRAYESDDANEIASLVERALGLDPNNPEALLLKADLIEDDEERLPILEQALGVARRYFEEEGLSGGDILTDEMGLIYLGLLQRTAFTLFTLERDDYSFELVEEILRYDHEEQAASKALYYRILLEREDWPTILEESIKETSRGLAWAYARLIASFMLSDVAKEKLTKMLWDAVRMAPTVPFYMLGYIPDPIDESEPEEEGFHFGLMFEDVWSVSREMLNWFSKAVILFGLFSGRFGEESEDMKEILAALGGALDYEELTRSLVGVPEDDNTILDALSAGNYPRA